MADSGNKNTEEKVQTYLYFCCFVIFQSNICTSFTILAGAQEDRITNVQSHHCPGYHCPRSLSSRVTPGHQYMMPPSSRAIIVQGHHQPRPLLSDTIIIQALLSKNTNVQVHYCMAPPLSGAIKGPRYYHQKR